MLAANLHQKMSKSQPSNRRINVIQAPIYEPEGSQDSSKARHQTRRQSLLGTGR